MGTPAPEGLLRLVEARDITELGPANSDCVPSPGIRAREILQSPDYKEEQLRLEFLNPFFTALGWDMDNKAWLSETFKQVIHEESIKVAGASKAPDYTFRIRGAQTL
jgi:hypothetical protein